MDNLIYHLSKICTLRYREAIGRIGIPGRIGRRIRWRRNKNLQGLIEFSSKFASRSFTRDWLTMSTVIHGFSHFNYAMLHYGALYYTLLKYTSLLRGLFHHAGFHPTPCSPLPSLNFSRHPVPSFSFPNILSFSNTIPSSFSFLSIFDGRPYLDLPFDSFGIPNFPRDLVRL